MKFRRILPLLIASALLLPACGSHGDDETAAGTSSTEAPVATTAPPAIDVRSRDITKPPDVEYLNALEVELQHVRGDIRRDVWGTNSMSQATYDRIDSIYEGHQGDNAKSIWSVESLDNDPDRLPDPGDDVSVVTHIYDSRLDCAVYATENDNAALIKTATRPKPVYVVEVRFHPEDNGPNKTPWKYDYEGSFKDENVPHYTCNK